MKEEKLPNHWKHIELDEIAQDIQYGYTESANDEPVGPKFLRITDIQNGRVDWGSVPFCEIDEGEIGKYQLKTGDLLFARTGGTVGKSYLIQQDVPEEAVFASYLIRVKLNDAVDPRFAYYFFQTHNYWRQISESKAGIGQPNVNASKLSSLTLPLPPLPEQRRIVAKIEELFSNLDAGMADLQTAGQQLERYRLSVLQAAVEGRLTADWRRTHDPEPADQLHDRIRSEKKKLYDNKKIRKPKERPAPEEDEIPFSIPERWSWIRITELMYNWRSGLEKRNSEQGSDLEYPYIKMGDITNDGRLTLDSVTRVDAKPENVEKYKLSRGDFLFNVRNSKKLVGKSCVFDVESEETYLFNNNILRVDFGEKVSTKYINYWFCSAAGRDMLEELKSSTTNVAAIYHKDFFTCIAPLPPLAEQKQTVKEVERLLSVADDAAATVNREHIRAERLRQSILKQAFSGRLVPHDEDADPPAIETSSSNGTGQGSSGDTDSSSKEDSSGEDDVMAEELYNGGDPGKQIEMDL